jgi:hypothetical protein
MKFLWAKSMLGSNGKVVQVWCKICTWIESKNKLLVPNLDSLRKHVGHSKALVAMVGVKMGDQCNQWKVVFFSKGFEIVL